MSNDLGGLVTQLSTQLRDTAFATWGSAELEDLLVWSAAQLWPRHSRAVDPTDAIITLVALSYFYTIPADIQAVSRLDLVNTSNEDQGNLASNSWEVVGDAGAGTATLRISDLYVDSYPGYTVRVNGYAPYDLYDNLPPDLLVPVILARARAEAYHRMVGDREQFKTWISRNQTQNVSINELMQMVTESQREADRLADSTQKTWQKPVRGRI